MYPCAALTMGSVLESAKQQYRGKILEEWPSIMRPCSANGAHTVTFKGYIVRVCGAHKNNPENFPMQARYVREQNPTYAEVVKPTEVAHINIHTKEEVVQPKMTFDGSDLSDPEIKEAYMNSAEGYYCGYITGTIPVNNFGKPEWKYEDFLCHTWWPTQEALNEHRKTHEAPAEEYTMVTGHAVLPYPGVVKSALKEIRHQLSGPGVSGGALGADRIWALVNYEENFPYIIVVPKGYEEVFVKKDADRGYALRENWEQVMEKWYKMLDLAAKVLDENGQPHPHPTRTTRSDYVKFATFTRNHTMVDMSTNHVVVSKENPMYYVNNPRVRGGTAECVRYMYNSPKVTKVWWVDASKSIPVITLIDHFGKEK